MAFTATTPNSAGAWRPDVYTFAPTDVVVIGDTPHDIDCARAFGAVAIAVSTGQYTRAALLAESPDHLFDDLGDVEQVLAVVLGRMREAPKRE